MTSKSHFPIIAVCNDSEPFLAGTPSMIGSGKSFRVLHTRATKLMEQQVRKNALELDEINLEEHIGEFVTYHQGVFLFSDSFENAFQLAMNTFGEGVGFVVREVGYTPQLSSLVKG